MARDIWIISDTHFQHEGIIHYCDRPFSSSEEMDQTMIENWNKTVRPGDIVYHLGDVFFGNKDEADKLLSKLHGKKRLVVGNHDNVELPVFKRHFKKIRMWRYFSEHGLLLTHVPVHEDALYRGEDLPRLVNVHGHTHQTGPKGRYLNACVEHWDYTPVHIEEFAKLAKEIK